MPFPMQPKKLYKLRLFWRIDTICSQVKNNENGLWFCPAQLILTDIIKKISLYYVRSLNVRCWSHPKVQNQTASGSLWGWSYHSMCDLSRCRETALVAIFFQHLIFQREPNRRKCGAALLRRQNSKKSREKMRLRGPVLIMTKAICDSYLTEPQHCEISPARSWNWPSFLHLSPSEVTKHLMVRILSFFFYVTLEASFN